MALLILTGVHFPRIWSFWNCYDAAEIEPQALYVTALVKWQPEVLITLLVRSSVVPKRLRVKQVRQKNELHK